jgi:predicted dehydrogenase
MRVAIVGAGTMGALHADSVAAIDGWHVDTVFVGDAQPKAGLLEKHRAVLCRSEQELWERDCDVVVVCTPTATHAHYAIRALELGKHVFVEKPIARTSDDAERVVRVAAGAGTTFMVGHVLRFFHEYVHVKSLLDKGTIGTPGVARLARRGRFPQGDNNWYSDYTQSGGVILDMVIHDIDFLRWCFGEVEEVCAGSLMARGVRDSDYALIVLRFTNGVIGHVEGSWAYEGEFHSTLEIAGSSGLMSYNSLDAAPILALFKQSDAKSAGVAVPKSPVKISPYVSEMRHFAECVRNGTPPTITGEDACQTLRVALAALQSAESGQPVRLSSDALPTTRR